MLLHGYVHPDDVTPVHQELMYLRTICKKISQLPLQRRTFARSVFFYTLFAEPPIFVYILCQTLLLSPLGGQGSTRGAAPGPPRSRRIIGNVPSRISLILIILSLMHGSFLLT